MRLKLDHNLELELHTLITSTTDPSFLFLASSSPVVSFHLTRSHSLLSILVSLFPILSLFSSRVFYKLAPDVENIDTPSFFFYFFLVFPISSFCVSFSLLLSLATKLQDSASWQDSLLQFSVPRCLFLS